MQENLSDRLDLIVGSQVRLAHPRWDQRTTTVTFVFQAENEAYLSPPLENRSLWRVSELVLVQGPNG